MIGPGNPNGGFGLFSVYLQCLFFLPQIGRNKNRMEKPAREGLQWKENAFPQFFCIEP